MTIARELKDKGVTILFETNSIDTTDDDAWLKLSIMATLAEEEIQAMTKTLLEITKQDKVEVKYFEDGHYFTIQGKSKIDFNEKSIEIDHKKIQFDDIKSIKIL